MLLLWELGTLYKGSIQALCYHAEMIEESTFMYNTCASWTLKIDSNTFKRVKIEAPRLILEQLLVHELHAEALTKTLREIANVHRLCRSHLHKMSQCAQHNHNELANQKAKSNQHQDLCMWRPKYGNTLLILASQNSKEAKAVLVKE